MYKYTLTTYYCNIQRKVHDSVNTFIMIIIIIVHVKSIIKNTVFPHIIMTGSNKRLTFRYAYLFVLTTKLKQRLRDSYCHIEVLIGTQLVLVRQLNRNYSNRILIT